eukprot:Pgem_evm1s17436
MVYNRVAYENNAIANLVLKSNKNENEHPTTKSDKRTSKISNISNVTNTPELQHEQLEHEQVMKEKQQEQFLLYQQQQQQQQPQEQEQEQLAQSLTGSTLTKKISDSAKQKKEKIQKKSSQLIRRVSLKNIHSDNDSNDKNGSNDNNGDSTSSMTKQRKKSKQNGAIKALKRLTLTRTHDDEKQIKVQQQQQQQQQVEKEQDLAKESASESEEEQEQLTPQTRLHLMLQEEFKQKIEQANQEQEEKTKNDDKHENEEKKKSKRLSMKKRFTMSFSNSDLLRNNNNNNNNNNNINSENSESSTSLDNTEESDSKKPHDTVLDNADQDKKRKRISLKRGISLTDILKHGGDSDKEKEGNTSSTDDNSVVTSAPHEEKKKRRLSLSGRKTFSFSKSQTFEIASNTPENLKENINASDVSHVSTTITTPSNGIRNSVITFDLADGCENNNGEDTLKDSEPKTINEGLQVYNENGDEADNVFKQIRRSLRNRLGSSDNLSSQSPQEDEQSKSKRKSFLLLRKSKSVEPQPVLFNEIPIPEIAHAVADADVAVVAVVAAATTDDDNAEVEVEVEVDADAPLAIAPVTNNIVMPVQIERNDSFAYLRFDDILEKADLEIKESFIALDKKLSTSPTLRKAEPIPKADTVTLMKLKGLEKRGATQPTHFPMVRSITAPKLTTKPSITFAKPILKRKQSDSRSLDGVLEESKNVGMQSLNNYLRFAELPFFYHFCVTGTHGI